MATKNTILGTVPKSRGRYTEGDTTTKWYYDNILEYKGSSFRCISEASTGITGAPATYNSGTHTLVPNAGWEFFVDTTGALDVEEKLTENKEKLSELESKLQEEALKTGGQYSPVLDIEQGAIDSSTGTNMVNPTRIRTNNFINAETISIKTLGNKVYVMGYKEDGTYISSVGWITSNQDVSIIGAVKYRCVFAKSNDATIVSSEFASLNISIIAVAKGTLAVKENVNDLFSIGKIYQFKGEGSTMVRISIKLCPCSHYSIWPDRNYSYGVGMNILGVYYVSEGQNITLFSTTNVNEERYDFSTPKDVTDYYLYIRAGVGDIVNIHLSPRTNYTDDILVVPTNFAYNTSSNKVSWDSLIIIEKGIRYDAGATEAYLSGAPIVFNKNNGSVSKLSSISDLTAEHIILLYYRDNKVVSGVLSGYVNVAKDSIIAIPSNIVFDGATVRWDELKIRTNETTYTLSGGEYDLKLNGAYLALNIVTGTVQYINSLSNFHNEHLLLLYYNNNYETFESGCLYGYYAKDRLDKALNVITNQYTQAYENVLAKSAKRMADIEWTPKAEVITNEGVREAGVTYKGIPYSSVKELQKFVGLDVSIHTFMTAVNDIHSLFYTERVSKYDSNNPTYTRSAYGITYHGENGISYYGNVCSAYVSICLGYPIQWDSWDWLGYYFNLFETMTPQSEDNLRVGDVLWEPGHCSVVTKITRNTNGELVNATISEQASPIAQTIYGKANLYLRRQQAGGVWCRVKNLSHNVFYTPIPFFLFDDENLYDLYKSFVYIDSDEGRKFYKCVIPNRRSTFLASDWFKISEWVEGHTYSIGSIVSHKEKLYESLDYNNTASLTDKKLWKEIRGVHEWEPYPYVYNNDIVSFAGDRAVYHENELIYINYTKGNYTQMELYKDGVLTETLTLSSDSSVYQVNVSSYCSGAGMYRARLTNGNDKSRFTYFEVVDAELSVSSSNGDYKLSFSSDTGIALEAKITTISGYPVARIGLTELDRKRGYVIINADALAAAQSRGVVGKNYEDEELYAVVTFAGQWGNVLTNKISIGKHTTMNGLNVYPNTNTDLGELLDGTNVLLAGRLENNFNFYFTSKTGSSINIIATTDELHWVTQFPVTFESGKTYYVTVQNCIARVNII